jgi:hypothetical protein
MRRRSRRSSALLRALPLPVLSAFCAGGLSACHARPLTTVTELPKTPRQPDGVAMDPQPALPAPVERAPAAGVVSLRAPVGEAAILALVEQLLSAFRSHDATVLDAVLSRSVRLLDTHGSGTPSVVRDELSRRVVGFKNAGVSQVHVDAIDRFTYADLGQPGTLPRPAEMRVGDVLVRVHLAMPHPGGERLLGDVIVLLIRAEADPDAPGEKPSLRIAGFDEPEAR